MGGSATLFRGQSVDGYLTYPQPSLDIARLNVDLTSMQVVNGTCFQCELDMTGGNVVSERGCVTVVGELSACIVCENIMLPFSFDLFCFCERPFVQQL